MPDVVGALIVSTFALEAAVASTATALSISTATVTSAIGSAAIIGEPIGLMTALHSANEDGADE